MLAFRFIARGLPRTAIRLPAARMVPRSFAFQPASFITRQPALKTFATTAISREPAGESDQVLSAKFGHEQQLEVEERDPAEFPPSIESFLSNSPFKFEDKPGTQTVTLTRQFGNETIKIEFNISDMNDLNEEFDDELDEDAALDDEEFTTQGKRTINQSGTKGGKIDVAPEDSIAPADQEGQYEEEGLQASYPLGLDISIIKPGVGATYIRAQAEDGAIEIESVNYFESADLIQPETPEQARLAQDVYEGPPFMNLDQELQTMLYQYLEERDINAQLASFLPEYVDFKEQREYVQWLQNMKKFIDA